MGDLASIRRSEASFREVKRIARLTEPLISTGRLIYVRPNYLAMLTEAPRREKLVVDGDRLYLAEGDAAAHVIDLAAHPAIGALVEAIRGTLAGDIAELRKNFSVSVIGTPARWRLVLIPRVPAIAHLLRTITFEGKGSGVRRLTAIETNGDEMGMSIGPTS
ncbi:MAG: LolA family protein [Acetobacteraceae bacterium]